MAITAEQFEAATRRGQKIEDEYAATRAYHDKRTGKIVVELASGWEIGFPPSAVEGLEAAVDADLDQLELTPSRLGLHFPTLDVDLSIPALFHKQTGSKRWMASQLGRAGGAVTSEKKASASRENGKRGGRPRAATPKR
jgi:hypothetical protein